MSRPRKVQGEMEMSEDYPLVKTLIQPIATSLNSEGRKAYEVDAIVSAWVEKGYKLITAFPYSNSPDFVQVLYVLAKQ
jgi:hypothetical protein